nr:InlB B-repeat-containing protein [Clostridia bacterium]
ISAFRGDFIITPGETTNILVTSHGATFNVTFEDIDGNALVADTCFDITVNTSKTVLIKKDGNVVKGYAYSTDEAKWTVADGLQGTYASGSETIVIDGASGIKIDGTDYNYTVVSNTAESKVIGVIMDGVYFEYALSGDGMSASGGAFVKTEPKVTITYDFGDYEPTNTIAAEIEVSKTVPFVLATPEHASMQFKGWVTVDGTPVELDEDGKYIPMANVTLKAVWAAKVDLHLIGLLEADGSTATIYLGAGDKASEQLTMYTLYQIDEATNTYFAGWFYDEDGDDEYESLLGEDTVFTDEDKGATILAKWVAIPAYVGSYVGSNTYNKNFCNSVSNPIDIAVDGTITGKFTGEVLSYNANTQIMEVKIGSSNTTRYFVYDTASGILLTGDSADKCTNPLSYDMDTFGAKRPTASFGLVVGTTYDTYILDIENKCGTPTILFHNNKIYANVVVTDGSGNVLTAATVKNSKIIVVKDATTNAVILEKASQGADFNTDQHCKNLDGYQGTYANGDDSIVLDGAGGLVKNSTVSGTYTLADEDDGYTIEVYLNSNTEYLHITLNKANGTYSVDKPVVTITFNAGANSTVAADANANINVVYTLPTPTSSGSETFRGWYLDSAFASAVPADWKPTADITIYAKWDAAATVTFHYNDTKNATAHTDTVYSAAYVNDKIGSDNVPAVDFANGADAFVGWFTKDGTDGDWGVAVTGDTVISETVMDVYAQWTAPHALLGSYLGANLDPSESGVAKETDNLTSVAAVDPLGNISGYTSGNIAFVSGNDGPFILGSATHGAADVENGVMFIEWSAQTAPYHDIRFLVKTVNGVSGVSTVNIAWNKGITKLVQIKYSDDSTKTAFIYERNIYGNVSWTAEDASGAAITDHANLTDAATLIITIGADKLTFVRANNDLVLADGYQGAYTLSGDSTKTLKVNGHDTVSGAIEGSYEIAAEGAGYTFDVYSADGKSYYQVTLDKTNMTYTVEKPVVTITFEAGSYATVAADTNANINVVYTLPTPEDTSTHMFAGWFLDSALENAVPENWKPTEDVTLYSKWVTPHVLAGSFKAANLDPSETAIAGGEQSMSSNLTIDAFGKVSGYVNNSTTISSYDSTTGEVVLADGYRGAADATNGVMYIDWQTNKTEPYHDIRFYAKTVNNVYATKAYSVSWDKGCTKLILVTYSDDSTKTVLIYNRAIYGNVTWTAKDGTGAAINEHSKLTNANRIDVTAGTTAFTFVKKDGNFTGLDGFEGTYTMGTTTITVDGGGEIKVGSMPYSYTVVDGKLFFIEGNQMHFLTVDKDAQTCAYVQDGFGGEYTLPDGTTKMTLDGLGKVTGTTKTYVVTGSNIAIYDGETVTKYGIDVDSKVFLGKSIFAGLTFEGNSLKLEFDDDSAISGKLSSTTWPSYEYGFTAEYNKSTNTLTFTITSQNYSMGAIGKTITATVSSGSITFSSSFKYDNSVDVNGKAVTNASFVI